MSDYSIANLREADDDTGGRVEGMRGVFGRKGSRLYYCRSCRR
jgi:hypothetical protein